MATTTTDNTDPTVNNSTYNVTNGRYVLGGTTEVSSWALEMWDANNMTQDPSDIPYFVEKKYEGKPQLLGYVFYGDVGLWWIICQFNGIIDPMQEIVEGKLLMIPTLERVKADILTNNAPGGVQSTRT